MTYALRLWVYTSRHLNLYKIGNDDFGCVKPISKHDDSGCVKILWRLCKLSEDGTSVSSSQIPSPVSTIEKVIHNPLLNYVFISSFSWDQDNDKVKIYLSLEE